MPFPLRFIYSAFIHLEWCFTALKPSRFDASYVLTFNLERSSPLCSFFSSLRRCKLEISSLNFRTTDDWLSTWKRIHSWPYDESCWSLVHFREEFLCDGLLEKTFYFVTFELYRHYRCPHWTMWSWWFLSFSLRLCCLALGFYVSYSSKSSFCASILLFMKNFPMSHGNHCKTTIYWTSTKEWP